MGRRKNPWLAAGFSKYEGFHLMPFDLRRRAERHEFNRQRVVASILRELYIMTTIGYIRKDKLISAKQAVSQNLRGSSKQMTEAAHCCPRQIMIGDKTPTEILQTSFPERAFAVNAYFAETDLLPANFNKADSRMEGNGLAAGFRHACLLVIEDARLRGKLKYLNISNAVRLAYSYYSSQAVDAIRISRERLEHKLRFNVAKEDFDRWTEQLLILDTYRRTIATSSGASMVLDIESVHGLVKIYRENEGDAGISH